MKPTVFQRAPRSARAVVVQAGLLYAVCTVALWPVPLLNLLHVESSALMAAVAFLVAGDTSIRLFRLGVSLPWVVGLQEALLLIPLALLSVTRLWVQNLGYGHGLMFYLLFPGVSVVLAVALAYLLTARRVPRPRLLFATTTLLLVILGPVYDLGFHPQFYTYNHVFGGVLGPIYDEELAVRPGLFAFRFLTLLWALLAVLIGSRLRGRWSGRIARAGVAGASLGIGLMYLFAAPLGINSPSWYIQQSLGAVHHTPHFHLYYDPTALTESQLGRLAADHEFRYHQFATRLGIRPPGRIESYLYPDPDTKVGLTGARYTNVSPVWLNRPQTHVLVDSYERVFGHELAHVFSRPFGLPVLNASYSVGLVEGWAVALEPPDGWPDVHEQVAAAVQLADSVGFATDSTLAQAVANRLSPLGFWSGRSSVSYTTMGSFVAFLLQAYGPQPFMQAYAKGAFEQAYGCSVEALAEEWRRFINEQPVSWQVEKLTQLRFSRPALIEQPSPHYIPPHQRLYRKGLKALAEEDTTRALARFEEALKRAPLDPLPLASWAEVVLAQGEAVGVRKRLRVVADRSKVLPPVLWVRLGDTFAWLGEPEDAALSYRRAESGLLPYERELLARLDIRRGLLGNPKAVRLLYVPDPEDRADRLANLEDRNAFSALEEALARAEAEQFQRAAVVMRSVEIPHSTRLYGQVLVWTGRFWQAAGVYEQARRSLTEARQWYSNVGDEDQVDYLEDLIEKNRWLTQQNPISSP